MDGSQTKAAAMTVTWVLEANVFAHSCFDEMVDHLRQIQIPYHVVRIVPFSHELVGNLPAIDNPCVAYGSIGVAKLAGRQRWLPGIWASDDLASTVYARRLGDKYLNNGLVACRLSEVERRSIDLGWSQFFLRPDDDGKAFPGGIVTRSEIVGWIAQMRSAAVLEGNDADVVIAPAQVTGREWRTVVVDGEIVAYSLYKNHERRWEERSIDPAALKAVEMAVEVFRPSDVFIVDVCETPDGMKIIEYNNFNAAGLYACDVGKVIDAVNRFIDSSFTVSI
jgi:hypothetical protein